jgi:hypothetical protein
LVDLIFGLLKPLYALFIISWQTVLFGGNRLPSENHHPSTSNLHQPFLLLTTDEVIIISPKRNGYG